MVIAGLWFFLDRTETGRAIRATAMDKDVARLMGVNVREIYAVTFGIGAGITGLAGVSISPFVIIFPEMGLNYTIVAFCVVVLGGMGYMPGALWGGAILGVAQSLSCDVLECRDFGCHHIPDALRDADRAPCGNCRERDGNMSGRVLRDPRITPGPKDAGLP